MKDTAIFMIFYNKNDEVVAIGRNINNKYNYFFVVNKLKTFYQATKIDSSTQYKDIKVNKKVVGNEAVAEVLCITLINKEKVYFKFKYANVTPYEEVKELLDKYEIGIKKDLTNIKDWEYINSVYLHFKINEYEITKII